MRGHAVILFNELSSEAGAAEQDVLVQAEVVEQALAHLGWRVSRIPCTLDLATLSEQLGAERPDLCFNLVESLAGFDSLQPLVPRLLDALRMPFSGSPASSIALTTDKVLAKSVFLGAGIPTPRSFTARDCVDGAVEGGRFILKPREEHASFGLDDSAIVSVSSSAELAARIRERSALLGGRPCFAEEFIEGREFNLSVLEMDGTVQVLPVAEVLFQDFPPGKPRIVGHAAKWEADSFEYNKTPIQFLADQVERGLAARLGELARECWRVCGVRGYARVDFRVDEQGDPWVLEINTNPCLSTDAGFHAALAKQGIPFARAIEAIVDTAFERTRA